MPSSASGHSQPKVLCVDLDGTLIRSDVSIETFILFLGRYPWLIFKTAFWLARGKACLKREIANRIVIDPATLAYREDVLSFLREEHRRGVALVLATASDQIYADAISAHLGIFSGTIGSDGQTNLSGSRKGDELTRRYGTFSYMGNSHADMEVWRAAENALIVNFSPGVIRKLREFKVPSKIFPTPPPTWWDLTRLLRVHQWAKNLIVFVPLLAAHKFFLPEVFTQGVFAFLAFSFLSSVVYIVNDLMDVEADRAHPTKHVRSIASGRVSIPVAMAFVPGLLIASMLCLHFTDWKLAFVLAAYLLLTTAYTLFLKRVVIVDVLCLAILYTLRLIGGHVAAEVAFSIWLLTFSMFLFFSLALAKRFSELLELRIRGEIEIKGRGYRGDDLEIVSSLGVGSGLISIMVLALYVNSDVVQKIYHQPYVLLTLCPLLLYWVARLWTLAHRGLLHEDPVYFAIRDKVSYFIGACCGVVLLLAACL